MCVRATGIGQTASPNFMKIILKNHNYFIDHYDKCIQLSLNIDSEIGKLHGGITVRNIIPVTRVIQFSLTTAFIFSHEATKTWEFIGHNEIGASYSAGYEI